MRHPNATSIFASCSDELHAHSHKRQKSNELPIIYNSHQSPVQRLGSTSNLILKEYGIDRESLHDFVTTIQSMKGVDKSFFKNLIHFSSDSDIDLENYRNVIEQTSIDELIKSYREDNIIYGGILNIRTYEGKVMSFVHVISQESQVPYKTPIIYEDDRWKIYY